MVRAYNKDRSRQFEHTRAICYYIAAVNRDPKKSFPTIEKFWPLPSDSDGAPSEEAEYKRLKDRLNQYKQSKKR